MPGISQPPGLLQPVNPSLIINCCFFNSLIITTSNHPTHFCIHLRLRLVRKTGILTPTHVLKLSIVGILCNFQTREKPLLHLRTLLLVGQSCTAAFFLADGAIKGVGVISACRPPPPLFQWRDSPLRATPLLFQGHFRISWRLWHLCRKRRRRRRWTSWVFEKIVFLIMRK